MKLDSKTRLGGSLALIVAAGVTVASCSATEDSGGAAGRAGSGQSGASGKAGTGSGGFGAGGGAAASGGFGGTGVTGGASGSGGVNGNGGSFGVGGSGTNDGAPIDADFGYDAPGTTGDACASETARAEEVPLDIYVMYDQSSSMTCAVSTGGPTRWSVITPAFQSFLNSPQAAGIGVGIQYFGQGSDCSAAVYFNPDVPIAPLPGNFAALNSSLQAHGNIGLNFTTTNAALLGAIDQAKVWKQAHTTHAVVVLLVTDGQPNTCGALTDVVTTAQNGVNGTPSIRTFVLGIVAGSGACPPPFDPNPPNVPDLDKVAVGGGTQRAYVVDPGSNNATQQLLNALDQIRGIAALPCTYLIPKPSGGFADTKQITVTYTPGGGAPQTVPKVANQAACNASGGGWYFDNNTNPTSIILCPVTCNVVTSDVSASVDVTVGCIKG